MRACVVSGNAQHALRGKVVMARYSPQCQGAIQHMHEQVTSCKTHMRTEQDHSHHLQVWEARKGASHGRSSGETGAGGAASASLADAASALRCCFASCLRCFLVSLPLRALPRAFVAGTWFLLLATLVVGKASRQRVSSEWRLRPCRGSTKPFDATCWRHLQAHLAICICSTTHREMYPARCLWGTGAPNLSMS